MRVKSIIPPWPSVIAIVLCAASLINSREASRDDENETKMAVFDDVPMKNDLDKYLTRLERIVLFYSRNKIYLDLNLAFGLFLIDLNLKTIFRIKEKRLPSDVKHRLAAILKKNKEGVEYFLQKTRNDESVFTSPLYNIVKLLFQSPNWQRYLQKFKTDLLKRTKSYSKAQLDKVYSDWDTYVQHLYKFQDHVPLPAMSDDCISELAKNPINKNRHLTRCETHASCVQTIEKGTNFGYAITHRYLYVLMARYSRGCTVISASEDKRMLDKFCATMYNEAEYIANHNFEVSDVLMEQIALCSLQGHVQFLRRSWIDQLLDFQTAMGCVKSHNSRRMEGDVRERVSWQFSVENNEILKGKCNTHTTATAAGMLSATIRFLLESFY
ncbi:uncharacterized protein LOC142987828 [Anticarsia gemmatalis]|uniref:uncharacterized protein LOC142987828 n=1 Tax=Anticarsia gemmatalis TaxID=129554 RepID=UPI003F760D92